MREVSCLLMSWCVSGFLFLGSSLSATAKDIVQIDAVLFTINPDGSKTILASPKLLTQQGEWASFENVEEITYPTAFNLPSIPSEYSGSASHPGSTETTSWTTHERHCIIPAHPTRFETRDHGLKVRFRPRFGNGDKVFVDCVVEQISFDGFVDHSTPVRIQLPKPLSNRGDEVEVDTSHTGIATFRSRKQEFLFSPSGETHLSELISDASTNSEASLETDLLSKINVSLEAKKIRVATPEEEPAGTEHIHVSSRFLETSEPIEFDQLVLSHVEFQEWVRNASETHGVDLLSAPSIALQNGQQGKIEVIREFIYPSEYDPPELPSDPVEQSTVETANFPVTPATPIAFNSVNTGVDIEVTARNVGSGQIELSLKPSVVTFEGFDNFGRPIYQVNEKTLGKYQLIVLTENKIEMPRFQKHTQDYKVTIADGDSIIVRGLMRRDSQTIETKVPVLGDLPVIGRMGRKTVVEELKRHIYIAVTAEFMEIENERLEN